jgi:hypothetical protein
MTPANDAERTPATSDTGNGSGLRLPRAFCPVCGTVWADPRLRCPNSANHPVLTVGDEPSGERA